MSSSPTLRRQQEIGGGVPEVSLPLVSGGQATLAEFLAGQPMERTETASFGCAIASVYDILPKTL